MDKIIEIVAFIILPIIGNLFIIYTCFDFMSKVGRNRYKNKVYYILVYIIYISLITGTSMSGNILLNTIAVVGGLVAIGHFLYNNTKIYLLYYFVFAICFLLGDMLVAYALSLIISLSGIYFVSVSYMQIVIVILLRVIEYMFIKLFIAFINKRKAVTVTKLQLINFLVLPAFSVVFIFTLVLNLQIYAGFWEIFWFLINITLILYLNLYVTYIFDNISKNNTLKNEINLYHQQAELQLSYYDNLERKYQDSRKLIHDIRNHLNSIEELYNTNNIETGKIYTNDIHKMLNELNQKYYSSNKVLNIILNDKFEKVKSRSTNIECRIGDVDLKFIKDIDITTIFANLLDNAIDAAIKVEINSFIKLDIDKFNDFIVINISNSMVDKPIKKGKRFKSTKERHEGLGIENIKKALEKYEGTMLIDYTDEEFKVNIVIPI
ncbi:GHKL domain-containing protein [Romboutsia weinsteinii]|uniref:GHKL domain-containing protein n=1 Tax=Romboutsia weinsteinii TaxID=2020949 RepID=A0A371IZ45_9FIRM|nr:sensor histidine kinase [Romboutsia weinsteinii]RDY25755.1 GHKL domain-containing protein [Romboutsia weinsteinii]